MSGELQIFNNLKEYCVKYNIPIEHLVDILEDQKVLPMIRGKATEFIAAVFLKKILDKRQWHVHKLNLNAQPGKSDEDISITFARTGKRLKVEAKNAVRGSFRYKQENSYFKVKCHKSRSNIKLSKSTNDRYIVSEFDLLICNVSNSIFAPKSLESSLPLIKNEETIKWLKKYYSVTSDAELIRKAYDDWRLCFPHEIANSDNSVPRTPTVLMQNDPHWFKPKKLEKKLLEYIQLS